MFVERNNDKEEQRIQELIANNAELEQQHKLFLAEMEFKQQLIELRREKNLTQNDVSSISGLSQQAVSRLEKGKGGNIETVLKYLISIGCTLSIKEA